MNLKTYAHENLDGLFDPNFLEHEQCQGWKTLKVLARAKAVPTDSQMTSLHPLVRQAILKDWDVIIRMEIDNAPTIHHLKTVQPHFSEVWFGRKTFEMRSTNDRTFQVGDTLLLKEWKKEEAVFTGKGIEAKITHVLEGPVFGLEAGYAILSFNPNELAIHMKLKP
jgi:hypothetical protein